MRRCLVLLVLLAASSTPAVAKMDGTQWKDAETKFHALFANRGMTDDKILLVKQIVDDGEPRSYPLVAEGVVLEAGHVGRVVETLATNLADLQKLLAKKDNEWYPGEAEKMGQLQSQVGALEREKADEVRVGRALLAAASGGSEPLRRAVLAKCTGVKDWAVRAEGARLAGAVPDEPASVATLQASLEKEADARVRIAALEALSTAPGTKWHGFVIARLADPEWGVQLLAARIAGARQIGKAIPDLIVALAKATPRVAEEVAASLRKLTQQMIAQRTCGDLLREEAVVIVARACAAPVGIAGRVILEVGAVDAVDFLALIGRRSIGRRIGVVFAFRARVGVRGDHRSSRHRAGQRRFVFAVGLLEERVLLQHPLDLGIELDRRQLQEPDRLLKLRPQRQLL